MASFASNSAPVVDKLALLPNGDLLAAGQFDQVDQLVARSIARWNGTSWSTTGADLSPANFTFVAAMTALPAGDVLVAGGFPSAGSQIADNIVRWDGATTWTALATGLDGAVEAIGRLADGRIVIGGSFCSGATSSGGVAVRTGDEWTCLGAGMDAPVFAVLGLANGDVIAAGDFTSVGGVAINRVARWDGVAWSPMAGGLSSTVTSLAVLANGDIVAVGGNEGVAGFVSRWSGGSWTAIGSGTDERVLDVIVMPDDSIVIGGEFSVVDGLPAAHVAQWNGLAWQPLDAIRPSGS